MPIRILPAEVASQIAAGEVVERPVSVVKELMENALDAGAHAITVTLEEAGRRLVEVADDGSGIPEADLALAVERHATSKLVTAADLFRIATLGFRGEALASIASVSRLTLTSRPAGADAGTRITVEGGHIGKKSKVGTPPGTVVKVEDLFYNVPARLKFLKQDTTERRVIDTLFTRYALAYPAVRFKLVDKGAPAFQTAGDGDRRTILAATHGVDVARQMLDVFSKEEGIYLSGYISPTVLTRSNRKEITFFVNGRWVQDVALTTALLQAYHTLLMVGRYPLAVVFLDINPEDVDVNVHPQKAEIRFRNPDKIFSFVQRAVRRSLLAYSPVPQMPVQKLWGNAAPPQPGIDWTLVHSDTAGEAEKVVPHPPAAPEVHQPVLSNLPLLRLVGQIGAAYLIAEGPDGLYLIDQHAAHERVLFEKLMAQHGQNNIPSQTLLTPVVVTLSPAQANLIGGQLSILHHFGFQVEPFGPNDFQVRALPALFGQADPASALRALVEDFEEDESPLQNEIESRIAARVCKRMAVKAGQALSPEEQRALLSELEMCNSPRTCPHGRPTMIHLSVEMLERQFGRKGAR
jgi:DNA mismatch repair protein MutL